MTYTSHILRYCRLTYLYSHAMLYKFMAAKDQLIYHRNKYSYFYIFYDNWTSFIVIRYYSNIK